MAGAVEDLSRRLECVKIVAPWTPVENPEVAVGTDIPLILGQHPHLSPVSVSFPLVPSSDIYAGTTNLYYSGNDYPEQAFVAVPDASVSGGGAIYTGSPAPALDANGYVPYPVEGVYYQNLAVEGSYLNQPVYSTVAEYPITAGNDEYVYGDQMQQYPLQPYYQHGHVGQYVAGLSSNSMMIGTQDPGLVTPNGYACFNAYMGYPFVIEQPEAEAFPVTVTYHSRRLRASAPAWVEPSKKKKVLKEIVPAMTHLAPKLNPTMHFHPVHKFSGALAKNDSSAAGQNKDTWVAKAGISKLEASTGSNIKESTTCLQNKDAFNLPDFITKYDDAKFFIIKSYSDDNVIKSIQYKVWSSTLSGNKKLDDAYHDAQRRSAGKQGGCPVFLFFSVNGSRQFCGVAEMTSAVDYNRTMKFWEQNKWSGSFQVKWRIVKDVPNTQFRGIILQNNENKPVTNSRDTQEVFLPQGLEMLEIFRGYHLRGCILNLCPRDEAWLGDVEVQPRSFPKFVEASITKQPVDNDLKMITKLNSVDNIPRIKELNAKLVGRGPESGGNGADGVEDKKA